MGYGKNIVLPGRPQITIWRMHFACRVRNATSTLSTSVIHIDFRIQHLLQKTQFSVTFYVIFLSFFSYARVLTSKKNRLPVSNLQNLFSSVQINIEEPFVSLLTPLILHRYIGLFCMKNIKNVLEVVSYQLMGLGKFVFVRPLYFFLYIGFTPRFRPLFSAIRIVGVIIHCHSLYAV
jgi:hypothetical protein